MKKSPAPAAAGMASTEKCLRLFNRIAADGGRTELTALTGDMALPRSTLYRLTAALAQAGLVARVKPGHFTVGIGLLETLRGVTANSRMAEVSRPLLQSLAAQCGATAHLGVLENDMVTYLVKASAGAPSDAVAFTQENAQLEAYCSGIGKVLLAWLPRGERETYLAGGNFVALTSRTITQPGRLRQHLKAVRAGLFARDDGEVADTLYCLAVPLWTDRLPMTAAISISCVRKRNRLIDDETLLKLLRHTATRIGRGLG